MDPETPEILARLRELLAKGRTLRQASGELERSPATLHRLGQAHQLPRRRRAIAPHQARRITTGLARAESLRTIARLAQVSASTVYRHKQTSLGAGPKPVSPWRCPGCGRKVTFDPSICCRRAKPRPDPPPPKTAPPPG